MKKEGDKGVKEEGDTVYHMMLHACGKDQRGREDIVGVVAALLLFLT